MQMPELPKLEERYGIDGHPAVALLINDLALL
jgi:hypothetical protein